MAEPIEHHIVDGSVDPAANYSALSVLIHWLGAVAVLILFFTHDGAWVSFHTGLGILLAVPLIFRVVYRWSRGFPRPHDQHPAMNFAARLTIVLMLIAIFMLVFTGLLMPLFSGAEYPLFGLGTWRFPYDGNALIYEGIRSAHSIAGHIIIPLFVLHIISFFIHRRIETDGNKNRMLKPLEGGK